MRLIKIKNTGAVKSWVGQTIQPNEYITLSDTEAFKWSNDNTVFIDVSSGLLVVNNGLDNLNDLTPLDGWQWLENGNEKLPISDLDGKKLSVHTSSKPYIEGITTYAVWTGSGDNITTGMMCDGDILDFNMSPGIPEKSIDIKFNQAMNGKVWIHEGYIKFENGGPGDYMNAVIMGEATPLQTSINLDLIITNNWITYSPTGAGTGTHGFADATKIVLIPRVFSKDGDWDYDGVNLTPNFTSTGRYKISDLEQTVHKYANKLPCHGTCSTYFSMTSDDTAELLLNYFVRITAYNTSNTAWFASVIMEIFRERTYNP